MTRSIKMVRAWASAAVLGAAFSAAQGAFVTLTDLNSTANFRTQASDAGSPKGNYDWFVDGVDQLKQQWFWYRLSPTAPEVRVDTLNHVGFIASDGNFNPGSDRLVVRYTHPVFQMDLDFILAGGTGVPAFSDMAEQIRITNTTQSPITFTLFQYADFDLTGTPNDDTIQIVNANAVRMSDPFTSVQETIVTPAPSRYTVGNAAALFAALEDATPTTLDNNAGPYVGDAAWAFQWDFVIPAGGTVLVSKDKQLIVVPEPASLSLLGLAAGLILRRRRTA